jgi:hypothetical protein
MAKKNRRTKNPVPVWGWAVGAGVVIVGYYLWSEASKAKRAAALWQQDAALRYQATHGSVAQIADTQPPVSDAKGATYTRMMETLRKFEEARKAAQ